ncbi:MAG: hypothetical protein E6J78_15495 [Deltaproteobacteria bacterium]|nr:MAG: hypothetical protein E6J78_15495 [Deltaproteobacteria bacterium]
MVLLSLVLAIAPSNAEGDVQAFPALTDVHGDPIAEGRYIQKVEGDVLHIESRFDFPGGRTIVERAALRLHPQIVQESWDWTERDGERLVRQYEADFIAKKGVATRVDQHKRWKEDLDIEPGKTFGGIGFETVVKALRSQLAPGEHVDLRAVAFTPKPRTARVTVTRDGNDPVRMAGRTIPGDRYTIHVDIPGLVRLFVDPPDVRIWLVGSDPAAFLRFEGPMIEPKDPLVRIDLIPGPLAHAQPRAKTAP